MKPTPDKRLRVLALVCALWATCACAGPRKVSFAHEPETTASGVLIQDVLEGSGRRALPGRTVRIDYVAKLEDDTTVDSTYQRGVPYEFVMGDAPIAGWDEGLLDMRAGGKRQLTIPAPLAYGEEGVDGIIPPGATLRFQIELLSVEGE